MYFAISVLVAALSTCRSLPSISPRGGNDMSEIPLGRGAEFDLIRRILASGAASAHVLPEAVRVGPGDDCAVVRGDGIALSVDMSVEGVHFRREWLEPQEIGYRATAAALSDLAAVAATPIGVLVALAARRDDMENMAERVMSGARAAAAHAGAALLGGDITRIDGPMVIDVVVIGNAARPALRRGARPGDSLWVTGELGAAATAVLAWQQGRAPENAARHAFAAPAARLSEATWLADRGAISALIDVSDGIAGDAGHLAAASSVQIVIDAASIPIHPTVRAMFPDPRAALELAMRGGEDYELCFAAPPHAVEPLIESFRGTFEIALTCIGSVVQGSGVHLRDLEGNIAELQYSGYDHLQGGAS
jgi:thiamine-monophosphate kinase